MVAQNMSGLLSTLSGIASVEYSRCCDGRSIHFLGRLQDRTAVVTMDLEQVGNGVKDFRARYAGGVCAQVPMQDGCAVVEFDDLGHASTTAVAGYVFVATQKKRFSSAILRKAVNGVVRSKSPWPASDGV
jgi:hypothetical protein